MRDVYFANPLHALLPFFLFLEQFALAADVTTVTFCDDVFANGGDCLAASIAVSRVSTDQRYCNVTIRSLTARKL